MQEKQEENYDEMFKEIQELSDLTVEQLQSILGISAFAACIVFFGFQNAFQIACMFFSKKKQSTDKE